jgi:SET domain-containing protein
MPPLDLSGAHHSDVVPAFMNHSCDPNTTSEVVETLPDRIVYNTITLKAIAPGDELTCDYT